MATPGKLWNVRITCPPKMAASIGTALENETLSTAVLAPPRKTKALVEALYAQKPDKAALTAKLALLAAVHKSKPPTATIKPVGNLNWLKKVAADFPPILIGRWTVYGATHRNKVKDKRLALQIDATSAFGTGEHPTTRGCLLLMDRIMREAPTKKRTLKKMLDVGCGSGILALAFTKACGEKAIAVDNDPESAAIAKNNARANKLQKHVHIALSEGLKAPIIGRHAPYDLILANIFANPLKAMAKDIERHLSPHGTVILSGILRHQAPDVLTAYRHQGLTARDKLRLGEWMAIALSRKKQ